MWKEGGRDRVAHLVVRMCVCGREREFDEKWCFYGGVLEVFWRCVLCVYVCAVCVCVYLGTCTHQLWHAYILTARSHDPMIPSSILLPSSFFLRYVGIGRTCGPPERPDDPRDATEGHQ